MCEKEETREDAAALNQKGQEDKTITLRVSRSAWELLSETLKLDSESTAFDPALREQLCTALSQVHEAGEPYVLVVIFAGLPEHASVHWSEDEAIRAAKERIKDLREEYDEVVVVQDGVVVFEWPGRKG